MPFLRLTSDQSRWHAGAPPVRHDWHRARALPATNIPGGRERRRSGTVISVLLHLLLIAFLISPAALPTNPNLKELDLGGGGPGPAGGGGGGNRGTGTIHYVQIAAQPKPAPPTVTPPTVVQPPKPPEPVIPDLTMPTLAADTKVEVKAPTPIIGVGGGTGTDGRGGNGPGSGGGVGSGVGPGRGSGTGPGTGGGGLENYAPSPTEMFIPPLPTPASVHGFRLIADFDIDEKGRVLSVEFTPTRDKGYNQRLLEYLKTFKFHPGTTPTGQPIRAKYQMKVDF